MYLVGAAHPNKDRAVELLMELSAEGERFVTDIEVYQEILHRYASIRRFDLIDDAFQALDEVVEEVLPFGVHEVRTARSLVAEVPNLSARDAVHVAVMRTAGLTRIMSFDRTFDACDGIDRIE
ncbi:MAG: type II toxin-antitoxin system VapC family toxin [Chloroflexi bacterium]|nr:type II toxin-antitoxin system VapC family toxin [Chloroflexota bacterium]